MITAIPDTEFAARRQRALEQAQARGLSGLVVWSRNATTVDWYGDVMYLTNHHTPFPQQPDNPPVWSGRGHSVLVMPVDRPPVLIIDTVDYRLDLVAVEDIRVGINVPSLVASVLREVGLACAPAGLIARESLLLSTYRDLCEELGREPQFTPCDEILEAMRMVKSPAELDLMRRAASIGAEIMEAMMAVARAGRTEGDVAGAGWNVAAQRGAFPYDIAITSGPHSDQFQWARLPSWDVERPLEDGDLIHIDLYGPAVNGYWTDFVRSTVVGAQPTTAQERLLEAAIEHVHTMIDAVRPGTTFGEVWAVGDRWRRDNGFHDEGSAALEAMFPASGHCIGLGGGEPPYLTAEATSPVRPGMVIAVETLLVKPGLGGAGFEQDIIVGPTATEVITALASPRPWHTAA